MSEFSPSPVSKDADRESPVSGNRSSKWRRRPRKIFMTWMARREFGSLLVLVLATGGLWAFVELADEVMEGETHAADQWILLAMRTEGDPADPIGPAWLEEMARDFTALGGVAFLTFLTIAAAGYLLMLHHRRTTLFLLVAVAGGVVLSSVLKMGFDRPRPDLVPQYSHVYTASFPSGHSMMAAVTWLTLAALLARVHSRRRLKIYFLSLAAFVTVAVGVSRVYVGVHWPTDVLAGWTAGAAWALLCWLAARALQQRGQIESEDEDDLLGSEEGSTLPG